MAYTVLDTVGIEFETEKISESAIPERILRKFNITHDASIQSDASFSKSGLIILNSDFKIPQSKRSVIGTEIVSQPCDIQEVNVLENLKELTGFLFASGEPEQGERSGIHIHINFAYNLNILRNAMMLGKTLEDMFYLIGSNGYRFRGESNDAIYCRPITKYGPPVVNDGNYYRQIFVLDDMIDSKLMSEFWYKYGNVSPERNPDHYHPARYVWLNPHSLLLHGTLEFRVFNKTLNPFYIYSEVMLCRKFCEYASSTSKSSMEKDGLLQDNSIFNERNKAQILETFEHFCDVVDLDKFNRDVIRDIMLRSPLTKLKPGYVHSHLRNLNRYFVSDGYRPAALMTQAIRKANYVDIHVLRGDNR